MFFIVVKLSNFWLCFQSVSFLIKINFAASSRVPCELYTWQAKWSCWLFYLFWLPLLFVLSHTRKFTFIGLLILSTALCDSLWCWIDLEYIFAESRAKMKTPVQQRCAVHIPCHVTSNWLKRFLCFAEVPISIIAISGLCRLSQRIPRDKTPPYGAFIVTKHNIASVFEQPAFRLIHNLFSRCPFWANYIIRCVGGESYFTVPQIYLNKKSKVIRKIVKRKMHGNLLNFIN